MCTNGSGWVYGLPKCKIKIGDGDFALLVPLLDRIVKLLGDRESGQIPRVAVKINVLSIASRGYSGGVRGCVPVDGVDGAERVDVDFQVG